MRSPFLIPIFLISCLLTGCGKEEEPQKNRSVQLYNHSNERIGVAFIGFDGDSTKLISEIRTSTVSPLVRFKENDLILSPEETVEIHSFSDKAVKRSIGQAGGLAYYVINIDTLEQVAWEDIRTTNRGVTIFFFRTYQKLEADSFRIVYQK